MISAGLIVMIVFLGIFNLITLIWMIFEYLGKKKCQETESPFCPSYSCLNTDKDCGILPYRNQGGKKICQEYLTQSTAPVYSPPKTK